MLSEAFQSWQSKFDSPHQKEQRLQEFTTDDLWTRFCRTHRCTISGSKEHPTSSSIPCTTDSFRRHISRCHVNEIQVPRPNAPVVQDASDFGDDFFSEFDTLGSQIKDDPGIILKHDESCPWLIISAIYSKPWHESSQLFCTKAAKCLGSK